MTSLELDITGDYPSYDSDCAYFQKTLDRPALAEIRDLAALARRIFHAPIAFLALLDEADRVTTRIGSGEEWWPLVERLLHRQLFDEPLIAPDTSRWLPEGADAGGLGFLIAVPVCSCGELPLGLFIVADHAPRPGFSEADSQALYTIVNSFTSNMELRMLAAKALDSEVRLIETEKRFRAIANSAPMLIIYGGPDAAPLFVNRQWLEFTGQSLQDVMGGWYGTIHPEYRSSICDLFARSFEQRVAFTAEYPMLRTDGEYRWMRGHGSPRFLENGTFMRYLGCLVDVTDYHEAVKEIERLKQTLAALRDSCCV